MYFFFYHLIKPGYWSAFGTGNGHMLFKKNDIKQDISEPTVLLLLSRKRKLKIFDVLFK